MDNENNNDCLICLDPVNINDNFILCTNCCYYCHHECLSKWFKTINTRNYYCIHCQENDSLVIYNTKKNKTSSCLRLFKNILFKFIK